MWKPIHLDYILGQYKPFDVRVLGSLFLWIICIFGAIWVSLTYLPEDWVYVQGNRNELLSFFLFNPPMLLGLILLFWFGFEWSFIPVFLSMFVIGVFSHLPFYWAILFAISFVFGLSIYAIVYHCLSVRYDMRSVMSFVVFIITSFVASTASSLGAFIWSLAHDLSAIETATLWNGWWTGSFLQSVIIIGPVLITLSPSIEAYKQKWFEIPEKEEVSTKWVYSAVILTTIIIAVFIYSGDYLAKQRLAEELATMNNRSAEVILKSLESFEIITWVSIWIIICVGLGGIFLIGSWNKNLQEKVEERTASLEEAEEEIRQSLAEKVVLLQEIHHRVKNNLAVVTALLDLQYMRSDDEKVKHILSDSKSRVKSMAFVHETLYQTENFSKIEVKSYVERLCNSIISTFKTQSKKIELGLETNGLLLEMNKAVPLGLILNEIIVNAFKHAFQGMEEGKIKIQIYKTNGGINLKVIDNGVGFDDKEDLTKRKSLGMTLIKTLAKQLRAQISFSSKPGETIFMLQAKMD